MPANIPSGLALLNALPAGKRKEALEAQGNSLKQEKEKA
jgi:hypothetical protein